MKSGEQGARICQSAFQIAHSQTSSATWDTFPEVLHSSNLLESGRKRSTIMKLSCGSKPTCNKGTILYGGQEQAFTRRRDQTLIYSEPKAPDDLDFAYRS